jgi:alanyl-tRNA synthetase
MKIFTGAFKMADTHGLPLALVIQLCHARGMAVSMPHFFRDALAAGWKERKILATIASAMEDTGATASAVAEAGAWLQLTRGQQLPG